MTDKLQIHAGARLAEINIVVNALQLCLVDLLDHIEQTNGVYAATQARQALIENVKNGNIDMAIFEDRKAFDFVVSAVEALPKPG